MKDKMPSLLGTYARLLLIRRRGLRAGEHLPRLHIECRSLCFEPRKIAAYRRVCGLDKTESVPLLYPQVLLMPLHMRLVSDGRMPVQPMGLVHVRNHVQRYHAMPVGQKVDLRCRILGERRTAQGLEFDIGSEVWHAGALCWQAISTYLARGDYLHGQAPAALPGRASWALLPASCPAASWAVPVNIGWRFARVSADFNPIHLWAPAARACGFPRAFAHGMWSLARSLAGQALPVRVRLDVQFKAPLLLGSHVLQEHSQAGACRQWRLLAADTQRPLLLAQLQHGPVQALNLTS